MFTFQQPYLIILLVLPALTYFFLAPRKVEEDEAPTLHTPSTRRIINAFGSNTGSLKISSGFNLTLYIVWALCVIAMMHPQKIDRSKNIVSSGYDIMLAVDLSSSMRALDFATKESSWNRLDVVKKVAKKFISSRTGDRIGLILFGNDAYLQSPLSLDLNAVSELVDLSELGLAGDATAIGDAITLAVKNLKDRPEGSRVLILMTDGDDTASKVPPLKAARLARDYGIKIYTIGVGKTGAVPYPFPNGSIAYLRLEINEELLQQIAELTGGTFYHATNTSSLEDIYKEIDKLEKTKSENREIVLRTQLYYLPLGLAAIILLVGFLSKFRWRKVF